MSLESLVREARSGDPMVCPECETEGEDMGYVANRCTTPIDECSVLWWYPSQY